MSDQALANYGDQPEDDSAEWRPYQVWASQMRTGEGAQRDAATDTADAKNGSWDPYTVWKQQVQQGDAPKSRD